jgi:hypothetical protein
MASKEQQVAAPPPRRQQPKRSHELGEPEGPIEVAEVLRLQGGDHRVEEEQAYETQEHIGTQLDLRVYGQRQQNRER